MPEPKTIARGNSAPQLQEIVYDFDPQRGWNVLSSYDGASQDLMEQLALQYAANGVACRLIYHRDIAKLEAHDATQQYTLDTWQILGNEESRDVLSHPTVLSICSDDQVAFIRYGINNIDTTKPVSGAIAAIFTDAVFNGISAGDKIILGRFVGLILRGSTDYRRTQYVLRHTTNCPNKWPVSSSGNWPANIAATNVDRIYSLASLLTEVYSGGHWILPLPQEMKVFIGNIPEPTPPANYGWGWLKAGSTQTTAANNRIEISTEYTHELWSTDDYGAVV